MANPLERAIDETAALRSRVFVACRTGQYERVLKIHQSMFLARGQSNQIPIIVTIDAVAQQSFIKSYTEWVGSIQRAGMSTLNDTFRGELARARVFKLKNYGDSPFTRMEDVFPNHFVRRSLDDAPQTPSKQIVPILVVVDLDCRLCSRSVEKDLLKMIGFPGVYVVVTIPHDSIRCTDIFENNSESLLRFAIIHLNPLSLANIARIVNRVSTTAGIGLAYYIRKHGESIRGLEKLSKEEDPVEAFVRCLYINSDGQQRLIERCINMTTPCLFMGDSMWEHLIYIDKIVSSFRTQVYRIHLYSRTHEFVDISKLVRTAILLGVDFGDDIQRTRVTLPPVTKAILDSYFLPFDEYLISDAHTWRGLQGDYIRNLLLARVLEHSLKDKRMKLGSLLPRDSVIYDALFKLSKRMYTTTIYSELCYSVKYLLTRSEGSLTFFRHSIGHVSMMLVGINAIVGIITRLEALRDQISAFEHLYNDVKTVRMGVRGVVLVCVMDPSELATAAYLVNTPREGTCILKRNGYMNAEIVWVDFRTYLRKHVLRQSCNNQRMSSTAYYSFWGKPPEL